ncbi:hypothetical protein CYMTET_52629 [Cymbomonas tetramitiformis]|uniref:SAM domain-containing protein n=1 Tax=Cymbomonas tetramitiformis TaxID=36881 RepID=A0AAE0BIM6_9CHLO|nr:hypothetical protein CYMTET_52629 [Cymbomonas tetramitiformis]
MSVAQIANELLPAAGLSEHSDLFSKHKISGNVLVGLTDEDIRELLPLLGDRVALRNLVEPLRAARRVVRSNKEILRWTEPWTLCIGVNNCCTCSSTPQFRLTSTYLEVKRMRNCHSTRNTVDLQAIEDLREESTWCVCVKCLPFNICGCGLHTVHIETNDPSEGTILFYVKEQESKELFSTIRNAIEQHTNEVKTVKL